MASRPELKVISNVFRINQELTNIDSSTMKMALSEHFDRYQRETTQTQSESSTAASGIQHMLKMPNSLLVRYTRRLL